MQTTSVKLYSLEYSEAKTYLAAALFLAGNIVLPQLFHTIRLGGPTWLPIYFFTLVGAYKYGWRAGLLVGAHDIAKAVLAVLLWRLLFPAVPLAGALSGAACVAGHMFPFYMRFHGGKGFAAYLGMTLALNWRFALLLLLAVSLITLVTDYVVLGTMTTVISVPLYSAWSGSGTTALLLLPLSAIIIYKHRDNLVRICRGTEIGLRSAHRGDHRKSTQSGPPRP